MSDTSNEKEGEPTIHVKSGFVEFLPSPSRSNVRWVTLEQLQKELRGEN